MTFSHLLRILLRQWIFIMCGVALGLAVAAGYSSVVTPQYSATGEMFIQVSATDSTDAQSLNQASDFTQQRVKSYVNLVTGPAVLGQVISKLQLPMSVHTLTKKVSAENPLDTVLLSVTVTDPSAARAADIANAVTATFPKYVEAIETPKGHTSSPVTVSVTQRATPAPDPVSPNTELFLIIGGVVGLALGIAAALARDQLNTAVGDAADVDAIASWPQLGSIPAARAFRNWPVIDATERTPRAEAFRQLRTYLQFRQSRTSRVIAIASALPGEGRTTVACNLAVGLARAGARVVLVDGALRSPKVAAVLALGEPDGLTSVLAGHVEAKDVMIAYHGNENLRVLAAGPRMTNPSELLGSQEMHDLLSELAEGADFVIVDSSPLLPVADGVALAVVADAALVVARRGVTRSEDLAQVAETLKGVDVRVFGSVLNAARRGRPNPYGDDGVDGPTTAVHPYEPES